MNNLYLHNIHVDQESKHTDIHDENMLSGEIVELGRVSRII